MEADGYDPESPTDLVGTIDDDRRGSCVDDDDLGIREPSDSVETDFSGTTTDAATPRSSIGTLADDSDDTADHPSRCGPEAAATIPWDSQQSTALSADRTLPDRLPSPSSPPMAGGIRREDVPGFTILLKLGRGGMGVVYKAQQHHLNRMVALKMIRRDRHDNPSDIARFMTEAAVVAQLEHENIVRIFHVDMAEGGPFFALELLEGGTLADRLGGAPQPVRDSATLVATLARAVHAAHVAGIMHRDLKPSNVLYDSKGIPKIVDFGLAKRLDVEDGETRNGQVIGTPSYMAPEQAKGWDKEIGRAADVYSLGVILYEMLTGRPPLKGMNSEETLKLVREKDPVPPSKLRPNIPFDLETVCLKCLDKEPTKRYADALSLAEDIDRFLDGKPVLARRTPLWERGIKLAKRRPLTTTLLALGIVASVAAAVAYRNAREAARLEIAEDQARLVGLTRRNDRDLDKAQEALGARRWADVKVILAGVLTRTASEPRLAEAKERANSLLKRAEDGEGAEQAAEEASAQFRQFVDARDEAFFLDTRFDGLPEENPPRPSPGPPGPASGSSARPHRPRPASGPHPRSPRPSRPRSATRSRSGPTSSC